MKKILLLLLTTITLNMPVLVSVPVLAVDVINPVCVDENGAPLPAGRRPDICDQNQTGQSDANNPLFGPGGILTTAINILSIVVGIAAVVSIIVSGLRLTMSGGEPSSISGARRGILFAVIGLVIAASAQLLVRFILSRLT